MLVLSRKKNESIIVGDDIKITIVRVGPNVVRIGIDAPQELNIRREEVEDEKQPADKDPGDVCVPCSDSNGNTAVAKRCSVT